MSRSSHWEDFHQLGFLEGCLLGFYFVCLFDPRSRAQIWGELTADFFISLSFILFPLGIPERDW